MLRRAFLQTALSAPLISQWKQGPPQAFEAEMLRMMEVAPVPCCAIGTVANGKPGWVRTLGVRNIETREPVQPDTIFQAASLSKQATAYAAFELIEQGKLNLDGTLASYVDDLEDPRARTVTVRQALSHSSGFPNWRDRGQKLIPEFAPGSQFQYSGEGFFYIQRILEQLTGQGFAQLMDERVFQPLQMTSTSMIWNPGWSSRYALPHDRRGSPRKDWYRRHERVHALAEERNQKIAAWKFADYAAAYGDASGPAVPNQVQPNAAASMLTTATDYARFLAAAITNPQIRKEQIHFRPALGWGLGWGIERVEGREYLWQWGDNGGFKNFVAAEPQTGSAIFVFTNGDSGARVYDRIVTHATGHDHPALFWV